MTSIQVFREFLKRDRVGKIDASQITSQECFNAWLRSRKTRTALNPEKAFYRALTAHVTAVDGRVPFTPEEEEAILHEIRKKVRWECFENTSCTFGEKGFRAKGFHEKSTESNENDTPFKKQRLLDDSDDQLDVRPDDWDEANLFMTRMKNLLGRFQNFGLESWYLVNAIGRMLLFAHGWLNVNTAKAQMVLNEVCADHPNDFVLIFDLTSPKYSERIILQNQLAYEYFGGISREHGGFNGVLFPFDEVWKVIKGAGNAFFRPGENIAGIGKMLLNPDKTPTLCEVVLKFHVETKLLICRGHTVSSIANTS